MSGAEQPDRLTGAHEITVDDVRQLMGGSTPHFAMQLRDRIHRLVRHLPADHPARVLGEQEMERLARLGLTGESRGIPELPGQRTLPSNRLAKTDEAPKTPTGL